MADMLWHFLRMSRWKPPGLAEHGPRATLYRAAMQQFEDLVVAAASTGPAASPLPLYYTLSQAGRAVLAVREPDDDKVFATKEHHGLSISHDDVSDDLLEVMVRPVRQEVGQFQRVANAISSPVLRGKAGVPLGALLASLPEINDSWGDDGWPIAVALYPLMELLHRAVPRRT